MPASTALRPHLAVRAHGVAGAQETKAETTVQDIAYWAIVASIYLAFGFLWYYGAKEKLIDNGGTMPAGLAKAFSGSFIDSFPGLDASWLILGILEAVAFLCFVASVVAGEFLPNRPKPILVGALSISLLTFAAMIFAQQMVGEFDSVAQLFAYFGTTVVTMLLVLMLPPRSALRGLLGR